VKSLSLEGKYKLGNLFQCFTILTIREILMFARLPFTLFLGVLLAADTENYIASLPVAVFKKFGVSLIHLLFCKLNNPSSFRLCFI